MRILLVEDDSVVAGNFKEILEANRYIVSLVYNGEDGLYQAEVEDYDVIILDWMLPVLEGIEVCKMLREKNITTPILMLTSKSQIEDKVQGLSWGADDYLTKPCVMEELLARVRALIRRKNGTSSSPVIKIIDLKIDTNLCRVEREGRIINLAPMEYSLLEYLALNKGKAIGRLELLEHVWGERIDPLSNTVDVHIRYLRKKIDQNFKKAIIKTVKGKGYMLCGD